MKFTSLIIFTYLLSPCIYGQSNNSSGSIKYDMLTSFAKSDVLKATLFFNQYESYFVWDNANKIEGKTTTQEDLIDENKIKLKVRKTIASDTIPTINYKNLKKNELKTRTRWLDGITYVIDEKVPSLKWKILKEEKKMSNFICRKATTNFRGRTYTAWFTMEIPVSGGPWKLQGLPGMIIEAYDETREIWFGAKEISYPSSYQKVTPSILEGPKVISIEEYAFMQENFAETLFDKKEFSKKMMAKMPRGATLKVDVKTSSSFIEKEFEFQKVKN